MAKGGTGSIQPVSGLRRTRVVEGLYFQPTPTFGGQLIGVYQNDTSDSSDGTTTAMRWTTPGGRVAVDLSPHFKRNADLGFDQAQPKGLQTGNLMKCTIASRADLAKLRAASAFFAARECVC